MTALTFESISYSPRRAAARRQTRSVPPPRAVDAPLPVAVPLPRAGAIGGRRQRSGLAAAVALVLLLHAGVIAALHDGGAIEPLPPKAAQSLALAFAPPPPPPEQAKPLPQLAKATPAKAAPPLPVVAQAPVDDGPPSANTVQVATAAPPAPVAAPAPAPPPPEPLTEPRGYAGYRSNPAPEYPALAQDRGLQGQVVLKVHVLASGKPDSVAVDKSSGHRILDEAAVKAVLTWAFDPARRGQTQVDGWVRIPLNFKLS